jgi:ATPase subunit of ABC transporter with duplicated ATPase domains
MALSLHNVSYRLPQGELLFENLILSLDRHRTALLGKNGVGKSTLLGIIAGTISPSGGEVIRDGIVHLFPQDHSIPKGKTIAQVLGIEHKIKALHVILTGKGTEKHYITLEDDWDLEERVRLILGEFGLDAFPLDRRVEKMSGGEIARLLFAAVRLHQPDYVLFDEPTNHLDRQARERFYSLVRTYRKGMIIVSHDRGLLRLVDVTVEMDHLGLTVYGGNYDFYKEQKEIRTKALKQQLTMEKKKLKERIETARTVIERQTKRTVSSSRKAHQKGIPRIMLNKLKGSGEKTVARLREKHNRRIEESRADLEKTADRLGKQNRIVLDIGKVKIPQSKRLLVAERINYSYDGIHYLWKEDLSFIIAGSERFAISGPNGSGKTTLMNLLLGSLSPVKGSLRNNANTTAYLDQSVSFLNSELTLLENMRVFNVRNLPEHDIRIRLSRFLFFKQHMDRKMSVLSGGEKMRLALACLLAIDNAPELLLLDEPDNNLDLESIECLTAALVKYKGCLIVVSHDFDFLRGIGIEREIELG